MSPAPPCSWIRPPADVNSPARAPVGVHELATVRSRLESHQGGCLVNWGGLVMDLGHLIGVRGRFGGRLV